MSIAMHDRTQPLAPIEHSFHASGMGSSPDLYAMLSMMTKSEIEVFSGTGGEPERAFFESALREAEIHYVVKSAGVSQHPVNVGPMSSFVILVSPEDEDRARELIVGLQNARSEDDPEQY